MTLVDEVDGHGPKADNREVTDYRVFIAINIRYKGQKGDINFPDALMLKFALKKTYSCIFIFSFSDAGQEDKRPL
jgi:hypothetical protein